MTFFAQSNRDARTINPLEGATGPTVGYSEGYQTAVDAQMRASSLYGIEYHMHELDWAQTQALLEAGVEEPPQLILSAEGSERGDGSAWTGDISIAQGLRRTFGADSGYYEDFIPGRSDGYTRTYEGDQDPEFQARIMAYDTRIMELRRQYPGLNLRTSSDMFGEVRRLAQAAEMKEATDNRSWGGALGGFVGGTMASMHPGTDPFNFYTLFAGGLGKTAAQRIGSQVVTQGAIETGNQLGGVQEARGQLGLSSGFADGASRVLMTAGGAGVLQGTGELLAAAGRRVFRNTDADPAPPADLVSQPRAPRRAPEAYRLDSLAAELGFGGNRPMTPRLAADIADVTSQLARWGGPMPSDMVPRTNEIDLPGQLTRASGLPGMRVDEASIARMAREADPQVFARLDKITAARAAITTRLQGATGETIEGLTDEITEIQGALGRARKPERKAELQAQLEAVTERQRFVNEDAPLRDQIAKLDRQADTVAPSVARAYERARGSWSAPGSRSDEVADVVQRVKEGLSPRPSLTPAGKPASATPRRMIDQVPEMARVPDDVDPLEGLANVLKSDSDVMGKVHEDFLASVGKLLTEDGDGTVRLDGTDREFKMTDTMFIERADGSVKEISIRDHLTEVRRAGDELEAVSSCSIR